MFKAGFDYSWQEASFAVCDGEGKVLLEETRVFPPRSASGLPGWLTEALSAKNLALEDISEWSVGSGPGSFTGLRVAAAFVMGLCFDRDQVRRRGVSTAGAMADSLLLPGSVRNVLALFDGHREELLGFGLKRTPGGFVPSGFHRVLSRDSLSELDGFEALVSLEKDAARIREIAGDKAAKLQTVPHVQASFLITNCPDDFSAPLTDPVYLRPAVFVEPRIPRTL